MAQPVSKSGDFYTYTDSGGVGRRAPLTGVASDRVTANGSPVLVSGTLARTANGTVVLSANQGSGFTINGNPVDGLFSQNVRTDGHGDLGGRYGTSR